MCVCLCVCATWQGNTRVNDFFLLFLLEICLLDACVVIMGSGVFWVDEVSCLFCAAAAAAAAPPPLESKVGVLLIVIDG